MTDNRKGDRHVRRPTCVRLSAELAAALDRARGAMTRHAFIVRAIRRAVTIDHRELRPDTGDGRSLPCAQCGTSTPDAMFTDCCGTPMCDNCRPAHEWCRSEGREAEEAAWAGQW